VKIVHTSQHQRGQVYIPLVNTFLAIGCLLLVVTFRSSARLAAAYGLAVACTMLATTITYSVVATRVFRWKKRLVIPAISVFFVIDSLFVLSGLPKFADGAWVPLAISAVIATISLTWLRGRRGLANALSAAQQPIAEYLAQNQRPDKPAACAVLLTNDAGSVPFVRDHPWVASLLREKLVVLLHLEPAARPYIEQDRRVRIQEAGPALFVVHAEFGYMETPALRKIVAACEQATLPLQDPSTTFFFTLPAIVRRDSGGMKNFQRRLFMWLSRVSRALVDDLEIPARQRAALGVEVAL
jgi:KUP system potassium uptake protein